MRKKRIWAGVCLLMLCSNGSLCKGQSVLPFMDHTLPTEQRVEDLISRLTPEEKVGMMMNRSMAVERLGVPAYNWWGEACHGLMGVSDVTVFPQCIALAATFDDDAELMAYTMVSDEARGRYNSLPRTGDIGPYVSWLPNLTFWAPNVNIFRDPRWGRGQETYGEDPYLTSRMGLNVVKGMQGNDSRYYKTHACAKHYAIHSGPEPQRHKFNAEPSGRDLWETYLPAFKTLVVDGKVQEVMCAYSAFEGVPCCNSSKLLIDILRHKWNFDGIVLTDCDAINDFYNKWAHGTHDDALSASVDAVLNGTDLECGKSFESLKEGVKNGRIAEADIDKALRRVVKGRIELGMFDPDEVNPYFAIKGDVVDCQRHRDHALLLAREAQVLLKNEGDVLPLPKSLKKIAVVGPNADDAEMMRGNYSGTPTHCVTLLQGIRDKMPDAQVDWIKGCDIDNEYIMVQKMQNLTPVTSDGEKGEGTGLYAEYFATPDWTGDVVRRAVESKIDFATEGGYGFGDGVPTSNFSARYTGKFTSDFTGQLCLAIQGSSYVVKVDGDTIAEFPKKLSFVFRPGMELTEAQRAELMASGGGFRRGPREIYKDVKAGETYDIEILYRSANNGQVSRLSVDVAERKQAEFDELKKQVAEYDAVIYAGGITSHQEGEGFERERIELPAVQRRCLKALSESGKPVVYVNFSGSCIALADVEPYYAALLQAWYPGQEGGTAIADVLFGDFNPSGKLPVTFYKNSEQLPDFLDYNMRAGEGRTYRYFQGQPLYCFGYGLSYTNFQFGNAKLSKKAIKAGQSVEISIPVKNTGSRDGAEVVQVYVTSLTNPDAPIKSLKAYRRVQIGAGQVETVTFTLGPDAFSYYSAKVDDLDVFPGKYVIYYGNSSRVEDLIPLSFEVKE